MLGAAFFVLPISTFLLSDRYGWHELSRRGFVAAETAELLKYGLD
jgi:hypothetical protein